MYAFTRMLIQIQADKKGSLETEKFKPIFDSEDDFSESLQTKKSETQISEPVLADSRHQQKNYSFQESSVKINDGEFFSTQNQKTILTITPLKMPKFKRPNNHRPIKQITPEPGLTNEQDHFFDSKGKKQKYR